MNELDQVIATAQSVVDSLTALKANPPVAPAAPAITEIDVDESDGTVEKFVPEV